MIEPSPSETARFGCEIGRAHLTLREEAVQLAREAARSEFDVVVLRYDAQLTGVFVELQRPDLLAILADTLVTYEGSPGDREDREDGDDPREPLAFETCTTWEAEPAEAVLHTFAGYRNHVSANPWLDAARVPEGYAEWAQSHVASPQAELLVLREGHGGAIVGLSAVEFLREVMVIDLAGITPPHRGRGMYRRLLDHTSDRAMEAGSSTIEISTQAHNVAPQRAWARRGWLPRNATHTVHLLPTQKAERHWSKRTEPR